MSSLALDSKFELEELERTLAFLLCPLKGSVELKPQTFRWLAGIGLVYVGDLLSISYKDFSGHVRSRRGFGGTSLVKLTNFLKEANTRFNALEEYYLLRRAYQALRPK
jgi:hypothetical protein